MKMNWFKRSQTTQKEMWGDLWNAFDDIQPRQVIQTDPPASKPVTLTLYRGFNANLESLQQSGGSYVLSPSRSEQGVLWFTHNLINGYNPVEYVKGRGNYLLTYPLRCKYHYQTYHYKDGSTGEQTPEEITKQTETASNCRFYRGYELPQGWFFSYKVEKFIICDHDLIVSSHMLKPQNTAS